VGFEPSASITQISSASESLSLENAISDPSGDQSGKAGPPSPVVRTTWSEPSAFIETIS
jgi:hypothetical protein